MVKAVVGNCRYGIAVGEDHACKRTTRSERVVAHRSNTRRDCNGGQSGAGIERSLIYCRQGRSVFKGQSGKRSATLEGNPTYESDRARDCDGAKASTVHKDLFANGCQRATGFEGDGRQAGTSPESSCSYSFNIGPDYYSLQPCVVGNDTGRDIGAVKCCRFNGGAIAENIGTESSRAVRNGYLGKNYTIFESVIIDCLDR